MPSQNDGTGTSNTAPDDQSPLPISQPDIRNADDARWIHHDCRTGHRDCRPARMRGLADEPARPRSRRRSPGCAEKYRPRAGRAKENPFGAAITFEDLSSHEWPKDNLPEGAFATISPVINPDLGVRRAEHAISIARSFFRARFPNSTKP